MKRCFRFLLYFSLGLIIGSSLLTVTTFTAYHLAFRGRIYPHVFVNQINFTNWTKEKIEKYFAGQNTAFERTQIHFILKKETQTIEKIITGQEISWNYHPSAIAQKAYHVGRRGNFFQNFKTKWTLFFHGLNLSAEYDFDQVKLEDLLKKLEKEIYLPPENALFQFENNKVTAFREEKEGQGLDLETAVKEIKNQLQEKSLYSQSDGNIPDIYVVLKIKKIKPEVTVANANYLGIKELLGEGISWFSGSPAPRIHNIKLASSHLNGLLVKPDEVFSFNRALGDVSEKTGYKETWIIKEGRTVLGDGGGVCQVSTTVFRAALNTGLPILERQAHAYRVHYYEEKSTVGLDATVYDPSPDLRFLNNTPAHLLIQVKVDERNKKLTFQFYGTSDGREPIISEPIIWDKVPAPEPLYQDDPELPLGTIKQIDWAAPGAKVKFDYTVIRNEETIFEKNFTSLYRPWRAIYLRGTKQ